MLKRIILGKVLYKQFCLLFLHKIIKKRLYSICKITKYSTLISYKLVIFKTVTDLQQLNFDKYDKIHFK